MKKIDIWLFISVVLAILPDPDNSDLFWMTLTWANLSCAVIAKYLTVENSKKDGQQEH